MQLKSEADRLIIKLSDGEALLLSLQKALTASNTKALSIDFGIGMLRDFTIGFFNGREYEKKTIAQPMELVALHGIVANDSAHLHCAVAGWDHTLLGGHLFEATVNFPVDGLPYRIATGDFDADGHADFAVANGDGSALDGFTVFHGIGNGEFSTPQFYGASDPSRAINEFPTPSLKAMVLEASIFTLVGLEFTTWTLNCAPEPGTTKMGWIESAY